MADSEPAAIGRNSQCLLYLLCFRHRLQCHIYLADFWLAILILRPPFMTLVPVVEVMKDAIEFSIGIIHGCTLKGICAFSDFHLIIIGEM